MYGTRLITPPPSPTAMNAHPDDVDFDVLSAAPWGGLRDGSDDGQDAADEIVLAALEPHGSWYEATAVADCLHIELRAPSLPLLGLATLGVQLSPEMAARARFALLVLKAHGAAAANDARLPAAVHARRCTSCNGMGRIDAACEGCGTCIVAIEAAAIDPASGECAFASFSEDAPLCAAALGSGTLWVVLPMDAAYLSTHTAAALHAAATLTAYGIYARSARAALYGVNLQFNVAGRTSRVYTEEGHAWKLHIEDPVFAAEALAYYAAHGCACDERAVQELEPVASLEIADPEAKRVGGAVPQQLSVLQLLQRVRHPARAALAAAAASVDAAFLIVHGAPPPATHAAAMADFLA